MKYDVALSFAGEDRDYVDQVAGYLRRAHVNVFYDKYEQVDLWGKNLYEHLSDVYQNQARYTVMFVSKHYAEKLWPRHERRSAQERAFRESAEYILPVRFDNTEVPGLPSTTGYLDLAVLTPAQLAAAVSEKLVRSGAALSPTRPTSTGEAIEAATEAHVTIRVRNETQSPIPGATMLLVAANGTYLQAATDADGHAKFTVEKRRTLTVFCAHPNYAAFLGPDYDPVKDLAITLASPPGIGSFVSLGGHGSIPGLHGSINPIHDSFNRLYVYTKNIAVDGGKGQPVSFEIGKELHFEDAAGHERMVTFVAVIADCFLIEHKEAVANAV
jgi:hypothetical protein